MRCMCILTDSTAIFPKPLYAGHEHVFIIPHRLQLGDQWRNDGKDLTLFKTDRSQSNHLHLLAHPPTIEDFRQSYISLGMKYQEIVTILISSHLSQAVENARLAAESLKNRLVIHIIDSQTMAAGIGLLVQAAAEAVQRGQGGQDINRLVRGLIRHIYAVFCLPDLVYLSRSGQVDEAQALVGEMLGIIPLFVMENGRLIHVQKIRNSRHMVDVMYEFVTEFEDLKYLALVQGVSPYEQEYRNLYDRIYQNLRTTHISEHTLSTALATILGPRCVGLVTMQNIPREA